MSLSVIETTVAGRYQVMSRIAAGGMGEVYRAHDGVLGREVALKVLHPQLAGDRGFVERFRREARAAAILNHSNIVGVYDWGETDGTYFMVMEYVHGHNLRSLLAEYRRLQARSAAEVAVHVLAALDHAHAQGIVHRDVKPENILIARDGTVKVADFGLARAFADANVSQAEGTVTGTVQYLAPEQIEGEPADPRTDLYALGIVLWECLVGRPPYVGETSLAIAYQHLSERVPAPSNANPGAGTGLDGLVEHATRRERALRPPSARAMRDELLALVPTLPPAPRLAGLADGVPEIDTTPPERAPTVTIRRPQGPATRRHRLWRRLAWTLAVLAGLLAGAWALWTYVVPHYDVVPNVAHLTLQQAEARLSAAGFSSTPGRAAASIDVAAGHVIGTIPAAGDRIRTTTSIRIVYSAGPPLVKVPTLYGMPVKKAEAALQALHLEPAVTRASSLTVAAGSVISQSASPGLRIKQGNRVTLVVSTGPPKIRIPRLTGTSADAAKARLQALGFTVKQTQAYSVTVAAGDVISTQPSKGALLVKGGTVTITVSKGPRSIAMPDLRGRTQAQAIAILKQDQLKYTLVFVPAGVAPSGVVVGTVPVAGTTVQQGSTVELLITQ